MIDETMTALYSTLAGMAALSPYAIAVTALVVVLIVSTLRLWRETLRQTRTIVLQETEIALQRAAADMHTMVNISGPDGRITYVNENLTRTTGFGAGELIGAYTRDVLLAPDDNDPGHVMAQVRAGRAWSGESKLRHADGSVLWTLTTIMPQMGRDGRLEKAISLRTDITESKLRQQEGPLRAIFDRLQDEVYIFDAETLKLHYLNKRARAFHGWAGEDYQHKTLADTDPKLDTRTFRERTAPILSGEIEALIYESELCGRPVEINLQAETTARGTRRFIAVVRDISQRKEAERERAAFVATVTHELRAPLTSIKGAMGLLSSGAAGPLERKPAQMVDLCLRNANRLIGLINDLLDLEKLDNATTEMRQDPVDLGRLTKDAIDENAGLAGEYGVSMTLRPGAGDGLVVAGDRDRLMQVLTNLLSNAAKFSDPGGRIDLAVEKTDIGARITVTDHGIGIPHEAQARLFERFTQADTPEHKKRTGTGLGLSVVKTIVERHGGSVGFDSTPGQGTTFHVDLPRIAGDLRAAA